MEALLDPATLTRDVLALSSGQFLADPIAIAEDALSRFRPSDRISTVEWAEKYRKFRTPEGNALVPYDRWRTPYNIAKMEALDDPSVDLIVIVKPSRSGGTTICENYLAKMIDIGPMGDVGWYLGSDGAVKQYCERIIKPMFEDHPRLQARVGTERSDDTDTRKRVAGHLVEFMPANDSHFRNREFVFGVMDEPDGWTKFSESPETQLEGRQKNIGRRKKGVILSHPDKGWRAGTAAAWISSSRGIYVMRCTECRCFAAAHATKYWPDTPQFTLSYQRDSEADMDERLAMAERTAGMACPHCGALLGDKQRFAMIDEAGREGWWMHRGQTLDPEKGITGEPDPHRKRGFYDHGLMLKTSTLADLARGYEEVLAKFERSGGSRIAAKALREFMSKQLGEIFEGKGSVAGINAAKLRQRTDELAEGADMVVSYSLGTVPTGVLFLTAAVDVGGNKFDLLVRGWDAARRSWVIERRTIRQRRHKDGILRDIAPAKVQEDWSVLEAELDRLYPMQDAPGTALPVAVMTVDASDGNVTWNAYEFARRMDRKRWGVWRKVRCIKGSTSAKAEPLPPSPTKISKDSEGRPVQPVVTLHVLGVHRLKEDVVADLAIDDGAPGQCFFPANMPGKAFDELFNEVLVDGAWVRNGPNETLDLFAYTEAGRLMLQPDRKEIDWKNAAARPLWARPVSLQPEGGDPTAVGDEAGSRKAKAAPKKSLMQRFDDLNS